MRTGFWRPLRNDKIIGEILWHGKYGKKKLVMTILNTKDCIKQDSFCNTADTSFGPVLGIQVDTNKYKDAEDQIYTEWKADDPRTLDSDEIYDEVKRIENIKEE